MLINKYADKQVILATMAFLPEPFSSIELIIDEIISSALLVTRCIGLPHHMVTETCR